MLKMILNPIEIPVGSPTVSGVTWWVSKSNDENDLDSIILNDIKDTVNLLSKDINYTLKENEVVYGRVKIHFSDNEVSPWSQIVAIDSDQKGFSYNGSIICTPVLSLPHDVYDMPLGGFELTANAFKLYAGSGSHKNNDWKFIDSKGNTVWERLKDENNLTSIIIPENTFKESIAYRAEVIFRAEDGSISNNGIINFVTRGFAFDNKPNFSTASRTLALYSSAYINMGDALTYTIPVGAEESTSYLLEDATSNSFNHPSTLVAPAGETINGKSEPYKIDWSDYTVRFTKKGTDWLVTTDKHDAVYILGKADTVLKRTPRTTIALLNGGTTFTLPANPENGDRVSVIDLTNNLQSSVVVFLRNGKQFNSKASGPVDEDLTFDVNSIDTELIYNEGTWFIKGVV